MFRKPISRLVLSSLALAVVAASASWAQTEETVVIESGSAVSIEYTLKLDDGTTVDSNVGKEPLTFKQGTGTILPALEEALLGAKVGDTKEIQLTAEQGYGAVNPDAFQEVPLEKLPEDARTAGTMLMAGAPDGQEHPVRVHEVKEETIIVDFNHPLAGQALNFDIKILAIE
ncbi:MAG: peptidylprolyl isomerase [Thermoanaerobaculia bacterium]